VYVFNNATGSTVTVEKLVVHEMGSSSIWHDIYAQD
jgi:hypothetical protein